MENINIYKIGETELRLKAIPPLLFNRFGIEFDKGHKPEVPLVETKFAGGRIGTRYDAKDETYIALMSEYESLKFQATVEYCIKACVLDEPPVDFVVEEELGENTLANRKVVWVLSLMSDVSATADFIVACLGQNSPVEEEINKVAGDFKSDD